MASTPRPLARICTHFDVKISLNELTYKFNILSYPPFVGEGRTSSQMIMNGNSNLLSNGKCTVMEIAQKIIDGVSSPITILYNVSSDSEADSESHIF